MSHIVEAVRWCQGNEYYLTSVRGSTGIQYGVSYGVTFDGPYSHGWTCACKAFEFGKGKHCKHIKQVENTRCTYGFEAVMGSPTEMGKVCPKCGGPTSVIKIAL